MDSSSNESKRRRSERLFKSLDLASISKQENSKQQTSIYDHLANSKNTIVAKISNKINFLKKPQPTQSTAATVPTEDDYIVLSSGDENENKEKNSSQAKLNENKTTETDQTASVSECERPPPSLSSQFVLSDENDNIMVSSKKISAYRKSRASTNSSKETTPKNSIDALIQPQNPINLFEKGIHGPILIEEITEVIQIEPKLNEPKVTSELKSPQPQNLTESTCTSEQDSSASNLPELKVSNTKITESEESELKKLESKVSETTKAPSNDPIPIVNEPLRTVNATKCIRALNCVMITNEETSLAESKLDEIANEIVETHSVHESNSDEETASDDENQQFFKNKWCVCDKTYSNDNDKKMCESPKCGQWYHLGCLGFNKDEISKMMSNKETVQSDKFICPVCDGDNAFIQKYKRVIELRTQKYAMRKSSSSSNDDDYEDAEDHVENIDSKYVFI